MCSKVIALFKVIVTALHSIVCSCPIPRPLVLLLSPTSNRRKRLDASSPSQLSYSLGILRDNVGDMPVPLGSLFPRSNLPSLGRVAEIRERTKCADREDDNVSCSH